MKHYVNAKFGHVLIPEYVPRVKYIKLSKWQKIKRWLRYNLVDELETIGLIAAMAVSWGTTAWLLFH